MLTSKYTDDWRLITELSVDWPFSQEEVYTALENEEYFGNDDRTYCHHIKSPILKQIADTVAASIPVLLAEMSEQVEFKGKWGLDYDGQLINNTSSSCHFICDKPGFNTDVHVDNRTQVCTGMLFFNSVDDPDQATTFYTTHSKDMPLRMSSKFGCGWYAANTHDNWHVGANNTQRNRYALIFINKLVLK